MIWFDTELKREGIGFHRMAPLRYLQLYPVISFGRSYMQLYLVISSKRSYIWLYLVISGYNLILIDMFWNVKA